MIPELKFPLLFAEKMAFVLAIEVNSPCQIKSLNWHGNKKCLPIVCSINDCRLFLLQLHGHMYWTNQPKLHAWTRWITPTVKWTWHYWTKIEIVSNDQLDLIESIWDQVMYVWYAWHSILLLVLTVRAKTQLKQKHGKYWNNIGGMDWLIRLAPSTNFVAMRWTDASCTSSKPEMEGSMADDAVDTLVAEAGATATATRRPP